MKPAILPKKNYRRAVWKNGLGHTDEIAIYPEGADLRKGDFLWRLSSARIEQASPFSAFPFHDRVLVILKGAGVHLTHTFEETGDVDEVDVPQLEPYEFPGDVPSRCELLDGPITDLSVFIRKAEAEATTEVTEVQSDEPFAWIPSGRWNFVFAAQGEFEVMATPEAEALNLFEGDTFRIDLDEPMSEESPVMIQGSGRVVIVSISG